MQNNQPNYLIYITQLKFINTQGWSHLALLLTPRNGSCEQNRSPENSGDRF
jgi:hypothetical protein